MSLSANRIPPSGQARGHASLGHALVSCLESFQTPFAPGREDPAYRCRRAGLLVPVPSAFCRRGGVLSESGTPLGDRDRATRAGLTPRVQERPVPAIVIRS